MGAVNGKIRSDRSKLEKNCARGWYFPNEYIYRTVALAIAKHASVDIDFTSTSSLIIFLIRFIVRTCKESAHFVYVNTFLNARMY